MKKLRRYFLPFCIIILSSFGGIYANSHQKNISGSICRILDKSEIAHLVNKFKSQPVTCKFTLPPAKNDRHKLYAEENEEVNDDFVFVNKCTEISSFFTAFCKLADNRFFNIEANVFFLNRQQYFSSCLYILFKVIRI